MRIAPVLVLAAVLVPVAGDFTGDHKADLAVGVPGAAAGGVPSGGSVVVLRGAAGGLTGAGAAAWSLATAGVPGDPAVDDDFGSSLATGDSDHDGRADLAVGAPYRAVAGHQQAGQVTVLRGAPTGLTATGVRAWTQDSAGVPDPAENGDLLGAAGVSGGNDNDDYFGAALTPVRAHAGGDDLAIGVPEQILASTTDNPGSVLFLPGSTAGLTTTGSRLWTGAQLPGGLRPGGHFGTALA